MSPGLYTDYQLTKNIPHDVYPAIAPDRPDLDCKGGTVLITGGGSGVGLATAKAFGRAGASSIVITGRNLDKLQAAATEIQGCSPNSTAIPIVADISLPGSVRSLWEEVDDRVGKIDVLVNNAGVSADTSLIGDGDIEDWWSVQQTNLLGTYAMTHAYLDTLAALDEPGTVINVVSAAALSEQPGSSAYSISKFATIKLTQFVHAENPHIRAFSVHPGIIPTDLSVGMGNHALDTVDLAAAFNLYLASPRAEYLRGRFVTANWDVEELEKHREKIERGHLMKFGLEADLGPGGCTW